MRYRFEGPGEFKMHELKWLKDKDPNPNRIILAFGFCLKKDSCIDNEQKTLVNSNKMSRVVYIRLVIRLDGREMENVFLWVS